MKATLFPHALETPQLASKPVIEINPYEQGFRDALLSVRAHLTSSSLEEATAYVDQAIEKKNLDLWQLLALAQADLRQYPEVELRSHLRAPNGVLIDSIGRMLFLRIQGTEYDTGVLGLLEEIRALKERVPTETVDIFVQGKALTVPFAPLDFFAIERLAEATDVRQILFSDKDGRCYAGAIMRPEPGAPLASIHPDSGMRFQLFA